MLIVVQILQELTGTVQGFRFLGLQHGGVDGVDAELDDLRRIALHGKDFLNRIQQRESEATGIQKNPAGIRTRKKSSSQ